MAKKIVLCCDGTGNDFKDPSTDSNVIKLYSTLKISPGQIAYYHPGVGTMGAPNARNRLERWWTMVKGMAFGAGLQNNVGDAYRYLMNTYEEGDQIFIFGFSRGAYTARAIASVLHVFGLLQSGNEGLIAYMLQMYGKITKAAEKQGTKVFGAEVYFKEVFARKVEVHFCGLWDTVSSYGWVNSPIELPFAGQNPIIRTGRHAISIHEHRCFYQDKLWGPSLDGQDIRQVWFSGVHSDVGGSYLEEQAGLSKITLEWMLVEAQKAGLELRPERVQMVLGLRPYESYRDEGFPRYVEQDAHGRLHPSLKGAWWIAEYFPREIERNGRKVWEIPRGRWIRKIPEGSLIHESVLEGPYTPQAPQMPQEYTVERRVRFKAAQEDDSIGIA